MNKKLLLIIPFVLILLLLSAIVVLFTPFGSNHFIKPIINKELAKKVPSPKITVTKLDSKLNTIELKAKASNGIKANANGEVDYFSKKFDLDYNLSAKTVTVKNQDILMNLNLLGQAVGTTKNFGVNGMGRAFDSDVNYKFIIQNNKPKEITANIDNAEIAKIFAFANLPPYTNGFLSINVKLPSLNSANPRGKAHIEVKDGIVNPRVLQEKFKIKLQSQEKFSAKFDTKVAGKYLVGAGNINATSAKIDIKKLTSTLDFKVLKAYYNLNIPKLSRISWLLKLPLQGSAVIDGILYLNKNRNILQATATTHSFGGEAKVMLKNRFLRLHLNNLLLSSLLKATKQPPFVTSGKVSGDILLNDYSKLNGKFNITSSGTLNKNLLRVELPSYDYTIKTQGSIKDALLFAKSSTIKSKFINAQLTNTKYALLSGTLNTKFFVDIKDLAGLDSINKIKMRGALKASGEFQTQGPSTTARFTTDSFGGKLNGEMVANRLKADFELISLPKVLYAFKMPHYFTQALVSGNIHITDTQSGDGLFTIKSKGGIDTATINKLYNISLTPPLNYSMLIKNGVIKSKKILTRPQLLTSYGKVDFDYLNYDIEQQALSSKFHMQINNLSKLNSLAHQSLKGSFAFDAQIKSQPNNLSITATAKELNGAIDLMVQNSHLTLDTAGISVVKLLQMLSFNPVLDGIGQSHIQYNTQSQEGKFNITIAEARFLNSNLVDTLKQIDGFDLAKEVFSRANIDGTIDKDNIIFNLKTHSQKVKINIEHGIINRQNQTINARVVVTLNYHDYVLKVRGSLKDPHIMLSFSGAVQKKVFSTIKKKILGKDANKTLQKIIPKGLKNKDVQKVIKEVAPKGLKGLFDNL